jgi:hypothetical protein
MFHVACAVRMFLTSACQKSCKTYVFRISIACAADHCICALSVEIIKQGDRDASVNRKLQLTMSTIHKTAMICRVRIGWLYRGEVQGAPRISSEPLVNNVHSCSAHAVYETCFERDIQFLVSLNSRLRLSGAHDVLIRT